MRASLQEANSFAQSSSVRSGAGGLSPSFNRLERNRSEKSFVDRSLTQSARKRKFPVRRTDP